jgi:hypothetical protein
MDYPAKAPPCEVYVVRQHTEEQRSVATIGMMDDVYRRREQELDPRRSPGDGRTERGDRRLRVTYP